MSWREFYKFYLEPNSIGEWVFAIIVGFGAILAIAVVIGMIIIEVK